MKYKQGDRDNVRETTAFWTYFFLENQIQQLVCFKEKIETEPKCTEIWSENVRISHIWDQSDMAV